jgi:hypothetical protein
LGAQLGTLISRDLVHVVAMTGSYFRGDSEAVLSPTEESKFETVTYTYYEQLNGYQWLKSLHVGYFFYTGSYVEAVVKVLVRRFTQTLTNKIEGFIFQFRRKPQRYP